MHVKEFLQITKYFKERVSWSQILWYKVQEQCDCDFECEGGTSEHPSPLPGLSLHSPLHSILLGPPVAFHCHGGTNSRVNTSLQEANPGTVLEEFRMEGRIDTPPLGVERLASVW